MGSGGAGREERGSGEHGAGVCAVWPKRHEGKKAWMGLDKSGFIEGATETEEKLQDNNPKVLVTNDSTRPYDPLGD
jgi:hypothetical protein